MGDAADGLHAPVRIKLCGMTRGEDVRLAVELGADYVGLILAPRSPRRLALDQAMELRELIRGHSAAVVLLMDNPHADVQHAVEVLRPDLLQFHGGEDDAFCASFRLPFLKAIAMGEGADPVDEMLRFPSAFGFVLDGHGVGQAGGSGQRFDWSRLPQACDRPILLAGGLGPGNVAAAIQIAHPWGVDVSSGIETVPGHKDPQAMRRFVAAVRAAADAIG